MEFHQNSLISKPRVCASIKAIIRVIVRLVELRREYPKVKLAELMKLFNERVPHTRQRTLMQSR